MRGSGNGDLYVQVNTEVPVSLNREQKELLEKFRKIENEKSNPTIKKFFQKAKEFLEKLNKINIIVINGIRTNRIPAIFLIRCSSISTPRFLKN